MITNPPGVSELYWAFTKMAAQAFGGVLPIAERVVVVDKKWLSQKDFVEMLAVAQAIPGPNIVNLSLMLGDRFQGWRGAFASAMGCLSIPIVLVSILTLLFQSFSEHPVTKGALLGMGAVSIGLVVAMGLRLIGSQSGYRIGWIALVGTVLAVGIGGMSLPMTMLVFGVPAITIRLWQIRGQGAGEAVKTQVSEKE
ncbi:MAG: chromate transporter [Betaproteobacteria bacterium]|nr:chromate transporter [Betaproteobacteria bacterium]